MFPILLRRFLTDADIPGTEKLAVSAIRPEMMTSAPVVLRTADITTSKNPSLAPMSVFLVKGWSRCVAAVTCLLFAFEERDVFQAG